MKFIFGEESYLIAKELNKIKKNIGLDPIIYNDLSSIEDIISEINTISLFSEKKLIFLKNIIAFKKDSEAKILIKELKNLDEENNILVFVFEGNIIQKNIFYQYLQKNAKTIICNKISDRDLPKTIREIVQSQGGNISASASISLANKVPNDLRLIMKEISKLLLETNNITKENIETSVGDYQNDNIFALSNALTSNSYLEIIKAYNEKINKGEEITVIISQIASIFNLVYKVMIYQKAGYKIQEIADDLKIHKFRIQKALDIIYSRNELKIKNIIDKLANLDNNIKTGIIDPKIGMDNLILELIK